MAYSLARFVILIISLLGLSFVARAAVTEEYRIPLAESGYTKLFGFFNKHDILVKQRKDWYLAPFVNGHFSKGLKTLRLKQGASPLILQQSEVLQRESFLVMGLGVVKTRYQRLEAEMTHSSQLEDQLDKIERALFSPRQLFDEQETFYRDMFKQDFLDKEAWLVEKLFVSDWADKKRWDLQQKIAGVGEVKIHLGKTQAINANNRKYANYEFEVEADHILSSHEQNLLFSWLQHQYFEAADLQPVDLLAVPSRQMLPLMEQQLKLGESKMSILL